MRITHASCQFIVPTRLNLKKRKKIIIIIIISITTWFYYAGRTRPLKVESHDMGERHIFWQTLAFFSYISCDRAAIHYHTIRGGGAEGRDTIRGGGAAGWTPAGGRRSPSTSSSSSECIASG
uniref:Uncharacterized protein n=1 Tax=Cacopsylla melanoneura TaxID=428564 RepID=A0A8D8U9D5_9HEMI